MIGINTAKRIAFARETAAVVRRHFVLLLFGIGCLLVATGERARGEYSVNDVLNAWEQRTNAIKSFRYECSLETVEMAAMVGDTDPFGEPVDKNIQKSPVTSRSELLFCMSNGRFASTTQGEKWDSQLKQHVANDFRARFDGTDHRTLMAGRSWHWGKIDVGADLHVSHLARSAVLRPFWVWYSPTPVLRESNYLVDEMVVKPTSVYLDGQSCTEITLPRKSGQWIGSLYVDPAMGFAPIKFVEEFRGKTVKKETEIDYLNNQEGGCSIRRWVCKCFDDDGEMELSYAGEVTLVSINEPVDDEEFTLEYPTGSHIIENNAGTTRLYIQEVGGNRREVNEDEFGRIPSNDLSATSIRGRLPLIVTAVLAVTLLVAVIYKHKH